MHACVRARSDERLRALHVRRLSLLSEDFCKTKTFVEKGACVWMGGVGMCVCVGGGGAWGYVGRCGGVGVDLKHLD